MWLAEKIGGAKVSRELCPACGWKVVESVILNVSGNLIISGYPTTQEMIVGRALLSDSKEDFDTMKAEFSRAGLNVDSFSRHCLYLHPYNEACTNPVNVISDKASKALVVGHEACEFLFKKEMSEVLGIPMKSKWMPGIILVTIPRISMIRGGGVGEYRLALQKYAAL